MYNTEDAIRKREEIARQKEEEKRGAEEQVRRRAEEDKRKADALRDMQVQFETHRRILLLLYSSLCSYN